MSLLEYYVNRARMRTKVMPALVRNGDVEGQYSVYVDWQKTKRKITYKVTETPMMPDGSAPNAAAEPVETIKEEEVEDAFPCVEVLKDADVLILPQTADSIPEAKDAMPAGSADDHPALEQVQGACHGCVKSSIGDDAGEALIGQDDVQAESRPGEPEGPPSKPAGIKNDGGTKFALVYQSWSEIKVRRQAGDLRIPSMDGEKNILGKLRRNPLWSDRLPVLSWSRWSKGLQAPVKGIQQDQAMLRYPVIFANDAINEAADSATLWH